MGSGTAAGHIWSRIWKGRQWLASHFSIEARACQHDVGPNYEPEGVVGHDLYFDEYAEDRQDHDDERSNKPKAHSAHLPAQGETLKPADLMTSLIREFFTALVGTF
jgi:hypothetical protein